LPTKITQKSKQVIVVAPTVTVVRELQIENIFSRKNPSFELFSEKNF